MGIRGGLLGVAHAGHDHLQGLAQGHRLVRTEGAVLIPVEHPAGGQLGDLLIIVLVGGHIGEGLGRQGSARVRGPRVARAGVAAARIRGAGGDGDAHRALRAGPGGADGVKGDADRSAGIAQRGHEGHIVDTVHTGGPAGDAEPVSVGGDGRPRGDGGAALIEGSVQRGGRRKAHRSHLAAVHAQQVLEVRALEGDSRGRAGILHQQAVHRGQGDGGGRKADVPREQGLALGAAGHVADGLRRGPAGDVGQRVDGIPAAGTAGEETAFHVGLGHQQPRPVGAAVQIQLAAGGNVQQLDVEAFRAGAAHDGLIGLPKGGGVQGCPGGGGSDGNVRRARVIREEDVNDALALRVAARAAGAVAGEVQGDVAGLLHAHAGHEDHVVDGVLPPFGLHVQLVLQPEGIGLIGGLVLRIQRAVHRAGQLVEADVLQHTAGAYILPEVLKILGGQGQLPVPGRDIQHVHVSGVLLHRDGQHAGVALAVGIVGGEAHNEVTGLFANDEAHVLQMQTSPAEGVLRVGVYTQPAHIADWQIIEAHILRLDAPAAEVLHRVIDLVGNGIHRPSVRIPQEQLAVISSNDGAGGNELIHLDHEPAGLGRGVPLDGTLMAGADYQRELIGPLFPIDGGGQRIFLPLAHRAAALAVVIPKVIQVVFIRNIGAAQGEPDIPGGQLGVGVPQGDGHPFLHGQVHDDIAVVRRAALLADAVDKTVGLGVYRLLGMFTAYPGMRAVTIVGVDHVVVFKIDVCLLQ